MSNLQYLPKASIMSNSQIPYKHKAPKENEKLIPLKPDDNKNLQLNYNNIIHLQPHLAHKEYLQNESATHSSFDKAIEESQKTEEYFKHKKHIIDGKREIIEEIVRDRDQKLKENLEHEKLQLKSVLLRIIKDSLKFTKECTPMISMMPTKLTKAIEKIKSEKKLENNSISLNNSINLSSRTSNNSIKRYESNSFLKELGLDLNNLTPDNINLDIDKAYDFVKKWKINREDVNEVIRMKVVNEIMNVEERRSVWRIQNVEEKIKNYNSSKAKREKIIKKENIFPSEKNILIKNNSESNKEKEIVMKKKASDYLLKSYVTNSTKSIEAFRKKENHECLEKIYGSETVRSLPHFEKKRVREKCVLCKNKESFQKSIKLNAYGNVDKIVRYINSNESLRQNENLSRHFNSIKFNKKFDDVTKKMIDKYNESLPNLNSTEEA